MAGINRLTPETVSRTEMLDRNKQSDPFHYNNMLNLIDLIEKERLAPGHEIRF